MKIESMDICDCSTLTFLLLQRIEDEANALKKEVKRFEEVNRMLVYNIQDGKITDDNIILRALNLLLHTTLEPQEIIKKCGV